MRACTLVWIDAREAVIVRWHDDRAHLERLDSDVPAHHRATGNVRHDPAVPRDDDLLILGPGTVRERLERLVRDMDEHHQRTRAISGEASSRLTDRQLIARLRHVVGADPRRRTVGAYRWNEPPSERPSGHAQPGPRRVVEKRTNRLDRGAVGGGGETDGG